MPAARAVRIRGSGGPEVLALDPIEVRTPGPGEILVAVAAAGLNRADVLQRRGRYPAPPGAVADVPGLEYAGTVAAAGPGADRFAVGDRVMGIVAGGGMATHLVVPEREAIAVPGGLPLEQAAAVPEAFLTAWDALFARGRLALGETVLIHAAASGVGTAALQLARAAGARVAGSSRSRARLDRCAALGLALPIEVEGGRFAAAVERATGGRGVDLILDLVGAAYLEDDLRSLALCGRVVVVGLLGGATATLPLGQLLARRATLIGTVLRSRPPEERAALAQGFAAAVVPLLAAGAVRPVVDAVLPMAEVAEAHRRMEAGQVFGKLVLAW
jgi:putative PIG3 family NAD(P)H quinone oxidoreductase